MQNLICIEGTIGAGKSTLVRNLKKKLTDLGKSVLVLDEFIPPVFLEEYISNPKVYAKVFQDYMFAMCSYNLKIGIEFASKSKDNICIIDRGLVGWSCFVELIYKEKYISEDVYKEYSRMFEKIDYSMVRTIYLKVCLETSIARIKTRSRKGEDGYDGEYLEALIDIYDKKADECKMEVYSWEKGCDEKLQNIVESF